jgi:hypothetical protein
MLLALKVLAIWFLLATIFGLAFGRFLRAGRG